MARENDQGGEECLLIGRWAARVVGLWPLDDGVVEMCKFIGQLVLLIFVAILPQALKAFIVRNDFNELLDVITKCLINYCIAFLKVLTLKYCKMDLRKLILEIYTDWRQATASEKHEMWPYARLSRWMLAFITFTPMGSFFSLMGLFAVTFQSGITNNSDGTSQRPMQMSSDFYINYAASPMYEICLVSQSVSTLLSCIAFSAYDCIYVVTVLHFSGQLSILQTRLRALVQEQRMSERPLAMCLKSLVQRHLHIVNHAQIIEDVFNKGFLVQMFSLSVALCLQGYQIIMILSEGGSEAKAQQMIFIIFFTSANLTSIFLYCVNAQIIRNESEALFHAAYEVTWHEMPPKEAVLMVLIMSRCTRPVEITAGKFASLSLEYFTKMMKMSAGYLSFLLAIKDRVMDWSNGDDVVALILD